MGSKHEKMIRKISEKQRRVKGLRRNLIHWQLFWGNIIKNKNFSQPRKPLHQGSRKRKHFYDQIGIKPDSGEVGEQSGGGA